MLDIMPIPSTPAEYQERLYGLLCWKCHTRTEACHLRQRYCAECRAKWNYIHRTTRWELIKAFALGAPAHQAARVFGVSYATAHAVYRMCREVVRRQRDGERKATFDRNGIQLDRESNNDSHEAQNGEVPLIIGILECNRRIFTFKSSCSTSESLLNLMSLQKLRGGCLVVERFRSMKDLRTDRPDRIGHRNRRYHIDRVESFWMYCRRQWQHAPGITAANLLGYLAESEFRVDPRSPPLLELLYDWLIRVIGQERPECS